MKGDYYIDTWNTVNQIKSYLPETEDVLLSARVRLMLTVMISKVIRKLKVKCKLFPSE